MIMITSLRISIQNNNDKLNKILNENRIIYNQCIYKLMRIDFFLCHNNIIFHEAASHLNIFPRLFQTIGSHGERN